MLFVTLIVNLQEQEKRLDEKFQWLATTCLQNYLNRHALKTIINENQSPVKKAVTLTAAPFSAWFEVKDIINLTYIN